MSQNSNFVEYSSVKVTVRGWVQGVGFRYYIARIADELDLHGYAKNLYNGDVEIYAEGRREFVEEMVKRAKSGPPHARVESAKVEWLEFNNKYDNFEIL